MNDFWGLGLKERNADAKHLINSKKYPMNNAALASLYYLLCEIYEDYEMNNQESDRNLNILRNAFEHKFVKIHETDWKRNLVIEKDSFYHVSEDQMMVYAMRLLRLSREALFYLVYAVDIEERKNKNDDKTVTMSVMDFSDDWKI